MEYKLGSKKEYVEGNVKHHYEIENKMFCIDEAVRWMRLALKQGKPSKELKSLCDLVEAHKKSMGMEWMRVHDSLINAQGYMWDHFKEQEDKASAKCGGV